MEQKRENMYLNRADKHALYAGQKLLCNSHTSRPNLMGGTDAIDNFIVLCAVCHDWVDRISIPPHILSEVKKTWIDRAVLGREHIVWWLSDKYRDTMPASVLSQNSFAQWIEIISSKRTFDDELMQASSDIQALRSEDELIRRILWPIFEFLAFEGITVLHHSGAPEHGKDMVFYQKDYLSTYISLLKKSFSKLIRKKKCKPSCSVGNLSQV